MYSLKSCFRVVKNVPVLSLLLGLYQRKLCIRRQHRVAATDTTFFFFSEILRQLASMSHCCHLLVMNYSSASAFNLFSSNSTKRKFGLVTRHRSCSPCCICYAYTYTAYCNYVLIGSKANKLAKSRLGQFDFISHDASQLAFMFTSGYSGGTRFSR